MTTENSVTQEPVQTTTEGQTQTNEPSPEERLAKLIDERVAQEIDSKIKTLTEQSRREIQSAKDKAKVEVQRAQRDTQQMSQAFDFARAQVGQDDPELATRLRLAQLEASQRTTAQQEAERQYEEARQKAEEDFQTSIKSIITGLGLDPSDPKIDMAGDTQNFTEKMSRILSSAVGVHNENVATREKGFEERLKALESGQQRQTNVEQNSVESTSSQQGEVRTPDAEFMSKFGSGELPMNKENLDRYNKIVNS